jgi:hypothetical protein
MNQQDFGRLGVGSPGDEPGVTDPGGVENQEIAGRDEVGEIGEFSVGESFRVPRSAFRVCCSQAFSVYL